MSSTYDRNVAMTLLEFAFSECATHPYEIQDNGVYLSDSFRLASPQEEAFDWTPAYELTDQDAPDPMTAPMLPIPFSAAELAAFMLDGTGSMVLEALACKIGDALENEYFSHPRHRKVREALEEALSLQAQALKKHGNPNCQELEEAQRLRILFNEKNRAANEHVGVFEPGISRTEATNRRARATASVQSIAEQSKRANKEALQNWKEWRTKMTRALLVTEEKRLPKRPPGDVATTNEIIDGFQLWNKNWKEILGRPHTKGKRFAEALIHKGCRGRGKDGQTTAATWSPIVFGRLLIEREELNEGQATARFKKSWPSLEDNFLSEIGLFDT